VKLNDIVRVTTGDHAGQMGRVINVFRGWLIVLCANSRAVQVRAELCELCRD